MIATLRYELVRISTVRSTKICLALTFLLATGLAFLVATPQERMDDSGILVPAPVEWLGAFGFPLTLSAVFVSVIAAQAIGQEYRFGLIRLTLTAFPDRMQVLLAKVTIVVAASIVVALASFLGSELGVTLRGHPVPPVDATGPDSTYFLRAVVFVVLWGLSAFGLAGVTRQTAVGIAVPLVSGFIVEQILTAVLRERADWLVRILPWSSATRWFESSDPTSSGGLSDLSLTVGWAALGVFACWVAALLVIETAMFLRRDA